MTGVIHDGDRLIYSSARGWLGAGWWYTRLPPVYMKSRDAGVAPSLARAAPSPSILYTTLAITLVVGRL